MTDNLVLERISSEAVSPTEIEHYDFYDVRSLEVLSAINGCLKP